MARSPGQDDLYIGLENIYDSRAPRSSCSEAEGSRGQSVPNTLETAFKGGVHDSL